MPNTNESAAAAAVADNTGLENILNAADAADKQAVDYSDAGVHSFLEEELTKLYAAGDADADKADDAPAAKEEEKTDKKDISQPDPEETEETPDEEGEEDKEEPAEEDRNVFEEEENLPILTDEAIDEQYPRAPHSIRNELKRTANFARKYEDFVNKIGGQDMIPVAATITEALKNRDHNGVFVSLVTSLGLPAFSEILDSAVDLAFVQPAVQDSPQTDDSKWFLGRMNEIANKAFESRFGKGIDAGTVDRLVRLQKVGALDLESLEELYADELKPENSPAVERLQAELAREREEKAKLQQEQEQEKAAEAEKRSQFFDTVTATSVEKGFEPLFEKSVLRTEKADAPEEVAVKEALRQAVVLRAQEAFRKSEAYKTLRDRFQTGEANTSVFTADLSSAVGAAVRDAKPFAAKFERLFKNVYAGKRNAAVVKEPLKPAEAKTPTDTKQYEGTKSYKQMSDAEWNEYQKKVLAGLN